MSYKMYDMATGSISIRGLQQNLKRVLARVERGQTVEVTRHRRPVARLTPVHEAESPVAPWPDIGARTRSVFGTRVLGTAGADAVAEGRGTR
jgi:prevent-host-death family protein